MPAPWYTPENENQAIECLDHVADITAFLTDAVAQNTQDPFQLSKKGESGLCFLLMFMESATRMSIKQICKRKKAL